MDNAFKMIVKIDEQKLNEILPELFSFWGVSEEDDKDNLYKLLQTLSCSVFSMGIQGKSLESVLHDFGVGEEGWPQMDGSWGIEITSIEAFMSDTDDFHVEAV
ncbi:hypothetical protein MED121_02070 [Marinomonas sp. MED121]|nr:hypothetical protein MED121_02070 [Marinomonas sp. MED121]